MDTTAKPSGDAFEGVKLPSNNTNNTASNTNNTASEEATERRRIEAAQELLRAIFCNESNPYGLDNQKERDSVLKGALKKGIISKEKANEINALKKTDKKAYNKEIIKLYHQLLLLDQEECDSALKNGVEEELISSKKADEIKALEGTDKEAYNKEMLNVFEKLFEHYEIRVVNAREKRLQCEREDNFLDDAVIEELISEKEANYIKAVRGIDKEAFKKAMEEVANRERSDKFSKDGILVYAVKTLVISEQKANEIKALRGTDIRAYKEAMKRVFKKTDLSQEPPLYDE